MLTRERRKLFERPDNPREFRLTERHLALLENIARFRLASSAQLAALDGGSEQNVSRALLALFENGYVDRPVAQVAARLLDEGSRPLIYGLTRTGANLLRKHGYDVRRRLLDGIDKNRGAGWRFVDHTVSVAGFMVALEVASRNDPAVRVLERSEILEDAPKSKRDRRVKLAAEVTIAGSPKRNAVIPDAFFGLRFDDNTESYFMLEYDRGEMSIERYKSPYQTYFAKKMATYYEAFRRRQHIHELGIENFRVLTVTTTQSRVESMLASLNDITEGKGSNLFLFAHQHELARENLLAFKWMSGKGERIALVD